MSDPRTGVVARLIDPACCHRSAPCPHQPGEGMTGSRENRPCPTHTHQYWRRRFNPTTTQSANPVVDSDKLCAGAEPASRHRSSSLRCGRSVLTPALTRRCPHGGRNLTKHQLTKPRPFRDDKPPLHISLDPPTDLVIKGCRNEESAHLNWNDRRSHTAIGSISERHSRRKFRTTSPSAVFDDQNLVSCDGLIPVMTLAKQTGLLRLLADKVHIAEPRIKSGAANPAPKLATLIAGMSVGADCIDDIDVLRSGGMKTLFDGVYAPQLSEPCCGSSPSVTPVNSNRAARSSGGVV